ncbi:NfeD family protein [Rhodococcus sp. ACT016]|uniref:NfeD family protein n=1 Tax=Rhodococcus sp. ACT016 TaxID=3134808 RepID=UPI003D2E47EC
MTIFFLACLAMGLVGLVGTIVVGDAGSDSGDAVEGLPFLSLTTAATALFGVGLGGSATLLAGGSGGVAGIAAAGCAIVLVFVTRGVLLPYLLRQQSNSHIGRHSYIGLTGTVTIAIEPGQWGEITFTDVEGSRVRARAVSAEPAPLPVNTAVYIGDVDDDNVHVVAITDSTSDSALPETN